MDIVFLGNSHVLQLKHLRNTETDAYDNGATVTVTVTDEDDTEVAGVGWPVSMTATGSKGTYKAVLSPIAALIEGAQYKAIVSAAGSGGESGSWTIPLSAATRYCG